MFLSRQILVIDTLHHSKGNWLSLHLELVNNLASRARSIWVMKEYGVVESWIKLSIIPIERVALCISFTEHGSLLTWSINDQVENQGFKFVSFDAETLHKKDLDFQYTSFAATFVESLVLLDEAKVICH